MFDIDVTYFFQFGLFLICLVGLNSLILKPFLKVIEERDQKIDVATAEVGDLLAEGNEAQAKYQEQMRAARQEALQKLDEFRTEGRDEERKLLADVRAEIADQLNETRRSVSEAEGEARRNLSADTEALARVLVEKVLGREVAA